MSNFLLSHVQEEGESPPAPPPRGPVYPPGTPVHQDYGTTPLGPVAASPAQGGGGAHLYPPAYDTPLHEPNYDDGYQVWISDFNKDSGPFPSPSARSPLWKVVITMGKNSGVILRDVFYLGWPVAPSYMSPAPNKGGLVGMLGLSQ